MENLEQSAAGRDAFGRFLPGRSGNPAGKAPGTRNHAIGLRAVLREGEHEALARLVVERALGGDPVAARFLVDRLLPKPRGRTIELALPDLATDIDHGVIFDAALRAMVSGEITPDEAGQVSKLLHERFQRYEGARPAVAAPPVAAARPVAPPTPARDAPAFSLHRQGEAGAAAAAAAPSTIAPFAAPSRSARRRNLAAGLLDSTALNRATASG
jgi:hypothetical protein